MIKATMSNNTQDLYLDADIPFAVLRVLRWGAETYLLRYHKAGSVWFRHGDIVQPESVPALNAALIDTGNQRHAWQLPGILV